MEKRIIEILESMQGDIKSMQGDIKSTQDDVRAMQKDIKTIDTKVDKNTIILENLQTKLEISAEVQNTHMDQNDRQAGEIMKNLDDRSSLIETAVIRTSMDVKEIKYSVFVLTEMTGKHDVEIKVLQKKSM